MNRLIFALFFLLFAAPSWAVGSLLAAGLLEAGFITASYVAATAFVINFAVSTLVTRIFAPKAAKPRDNGVRQQIPPATVNSIPIVYGDAYLGGVFVDAALSQNQQVMYYVLTLSSISANGQFSYDQTKFYYGDRLITFDSTDKTKVISLTDGNGNVDTKINGNLFINLYTSTSAGVISSTNGASAPNVVMAYNSGDKKTVPSGLAWPSSGRQMNGLAFAIVKLIYSTDDGTTNLQPITFYCSHYLNGQGVAKPGDVWKDYLGNSVYGGAVDASFIDTASATALNTYSDQLITYTPYGGGSATQSRYRINGVLDTGSTVIENINKILEACDSWMAYDAAKGQYSVVINKAESSSFSFDDSNIVGDIRVSATDINQSINQIEASFPNKLNKDIPAYVFIKTPEILLYPNEPVNKTSVQYELVNNNVQAYYLANRQLEQAREDLIVTIKTAYTGIQVNAGDVVSLTNSAYGWNNKLFRAMKVNEASLPDGNLGAQIELNEYNAAVYDDKDITEFSPSPNSGIPDVVYFGSLTAPTVTNQQPNAAVPTFAVDCVLPSAGQITFVSLYYTNVSSPTSTDWTLWGVQTASSSGPFTNSSTLQFPHIGLPTDIYYFAFTVGNSIGTSQLSPISTSYNWQPNPTTSAVAGTFIAQFSPVNLAVPYSGGVATFTGLAPQLYGTTAGGSVDFVAAQTDSDVLFVNNTWRIGGSSTTGYGDIIASGITIGNPTDGGFYALWSAPTAMSTNPATLSVPVRYKSATGVVSQGATAVLQFAYAIQGDAGTPGTNGTQSGTAFLYQWATTQPSDPNGNSTFTWATATNSNYTGGNGWSVTIAANPGTAGIKLWRAAKGVSDTAIAVTTTVSWASGFAIADITQNGVDGSSGTQSAKPTVYQWAASIPAGPTGTSTYTWSSGTFTPTPAGWTLTPGTSPSAGYTLWAAQVNLIDSATVSTSTITWTSATISAVGYAGTQGTTGASSRICFARVASNPTPVSGTITTSGSASFPSSAQSTSTWGFAATWSGSDPNPSSSNSLYQSDGVYDPSTGNTVWSTPYISSLKVGALSAVSANTGSLSVTGTIQANTAAISGSTMTGSGAVIYSTGNFAIGNSTRNLSFDGTTLTMNGNMVVTGNIQANSISTQTDSNLGTYSTASVGTQNTSLLSYTMPITPGYSAGQLTGVMIVTYRVNYLNYSTGTAYIINFNAKIQEYLSGVFQQTFAQEYAIWGDYARAYQPGYFANYSNPVIIISIKEGYTYQISGTIDTYVAQTASNGVVVRVAYAALRR